MEIFASYDLTRCAWSAAQLVGCDPKTVQRYVDLRDAGFDPFRRRRRARHIDPYLEKVEELVEDSRGKIRADVVHAGRHTPTCPRAGRSGPRRWPAWGRAPVAGAGNPASAAPSSGCRRC